VWPPQDHRHDNEAQLINDPFKSWCGSEAVIPAEIGIPTYRTLMIREGYNEEEMRLNLDLLKERRETVAVREAKYKTKMEQYCHTPRRGLDGIRVRGRDEKAVRTLKEQKSEASNFGERLSWGACPKEASLAKPNKSETK
ncbi:hypothetical protein Tco_1376684, partial [Tanacetum coccineum]